MAPICSIVEEATLNRLDPFAQFLVRPSRIRLLVLDGWEQRRWGPRKAATSWRSSTTAASCPPRSSPANFLLKTGTHPSSIHLWPTQCPPNRVVHNSHRIRLKESRRGRWNSDHSEQLTKGHDPIPRVASLRPDQPGFATTTGFLDPEQVDDLDRNEWTLSSAPPVCHYHPPSNMIKMWMWSSFSTVFSSTAARPFLMTVTAALRSLGSPIMSMTAETVAGPIRLTSDE